MKLLELIIGQVVDKIEVVIDIDQTKHASERKFRHKEDTISDDQILSTADKAIPKISKSLMFDKFDIGDFIHIFNSTTKLNLIGIIESINNKLQLKIITVIRKDNFIPKQGTFSIQV